jgi:hypothetical protein
MFYRTQDKINGRLDRRLMLRFSKTINHLKVGEVDLTGKRYTWSNNQNPPTLSRIDGVLYFPLWEDLYQQPILQPLSSSISDHCPLFLLPLSSPPIKPKFRF